LDGGWLALFTAGREMVRSLCMGDCDGPCARRGGGPGACALVLGWVGLARG